MKTVDAVVVGSGFGGAVAACRLAERGRSVLVLERGRRWGREDFPRPGRADARWWFRPGEAGLYERRRFVGMQVLVAAGVGGGSLIYTNVQKVPPAAAFHGWPEPITLDTLRPYYECVREMLEPTPVPRPLRRIEAFHLAHAAAGLEGRLELPALAIRWPAPGSSGEEEVANRFGAPQQPCDFCGECVFGCDRHAKNTLDLTYLKRAETLGAEVRPLCQVTRLEPRPDGYTVFFRRLSEDVEESGPESVHAPRVFLAAGSLGTTELLLRSRDVERTLPNLSGRLGYGWSPNGDFFSGLLDSRLPIVPTAGPGVAAGYDPGEKEGFYALEGALPAAVAEQRKIFLHLAAALVSALRFSWLGRRRREEEAALAADPLCGDPAAEAALRRLGAFFLMGRDASDGRLLLDSRGRLQLLWDPRASDLLFDRMRRYLGALGRGYGGWMIVPEAWWWPTLGTVHPLGGCGMGRDPSEGVADACGRVFGYPGLYVCDASLIPRALGVPPAMTIAALAEHIVEHSIAD